MKLNRSINPVGTKHQIPTQTPKGGTFPLYKVNRIIGNSKHVASADILVELTYAGGRSEHYFTPFMVLSLQTLASDGVPVTEADMFWIAEKTDEV